MQTHRSLKASLALALLSSLRLLTRSPAVPSGRYVPGTPGATWTRKELIIVKSKLWRILDWTSNQVGDALKALHGPGWEDGPFVYELVSTGRMSPSFIRLAFHGCVRDEDGTGGCDGCLYWDGIGRIYLDYLGQFAIPLNATPNFNNGLGPAVRLLEELYKNASFPEGAPALPASLRDTGKSRSDLWSLAGYIAVEHGVHINNMVCMYKDYEWDQGSNWGAGGDSLTTNSYWGKHCLQNQGTAACMIDLPFPTKYRSGRRDCVPTKLYDKVDTQACKTRLEIQAKEECEAAAEEAGVTNPVFKTSSTPHCSVAQTGKPLCHWSVQEKYGSGPGFYVDQPLGTMGHITPCRSDLAIKEAAECAYAARYLHLDFDNTTLNVSGCYAITHYTWGGGLKIKIYYGDSGISATDFSALNPNKPPAGDENMRSICRVPEEKVDGYMAAVWGTDPDGQKNGANTVNWFKREFGFTPKESVAIMGGHTMGRFHARQNLIRYIWIRNGGMMFNNDYFRLLVGKRDYRFTDPDCRKIGDAYGQPPKTVWKAARRGEMQNFGPTTWALFRHMCSSDCHTPYYGATAVDPCCTNIPEGGQCNPDNNRSSDQPDDDMYTGCESYNSEGGNHEIALPAEIGLYFKFEVDDEDVPYGCPGFENFHSDLWYCKFKSGQNCSDQPVNCPLNDMPAGDMKLYEIVELFADDQDEWLRTFQPAWSKMLHNGYTDADLSSREDITTNVICPSQNYGILHESLKQTVCFSMDRLSDPFVLISDLDQRLLFVNETVGGLLMGRKWNASAKVESLSKSEVWYLAETESGDRLINGIMHFGVGNLRFDMTLSRIVGDEGMIGRHWPGLFPEIWWFTEPSWHAPMQTWYIEAYHGQISDTMQSPFIMSSQIHTS